jgi:hypothetical protein
MAYTHRGSSTNIIVGAASLFTFEGGLLTDADLPDLATTDADVSVREALQVGANAANAWTSTDGFRNVGYTSNGLEIQFQPDFGEVKVDQVLDVAKLYKQGMQVSLKTAFAEATLENLLFAVAGTDSQLATGPATIADPSDNTQTISNPFAGQNVLNMTAGELGECPVERGLVAVGPGTGDCEAGSSIERVYVAYRALSIESVSVSAKRDESTMFEVSFRLLPNDAGSYGKIVDRTISGS